MNLDLAFAIGCGDNEPLPAALSPLLTAGGSLTSTGAEQCWQQVFRQWLAELAADLPAALHVGEYSLGLMLTDDSTIAALNGQWRHRPEPTDVLSFAALEAAEPDGAAALPAMPCPGGWEESEGGEPLELGDIVISLQTAARQAGDSPGALEHELLFLASHGLLHLLGWDHPDDASLTLMLDRQETLIQGLAASAVLTR